MPLKNCPYDEPGTLELWLDGEWLVGDGGEGGKIFYLLDFEIL